MISGSQVQAVVSSDCNSAKLPGLSSDCILECTLKIVTSTVYDSNITTRLQHATISQSTIRPEALKRHS